MYAGGYWENKMHLCSLQPALTLDWWCFAVSGQRKPKCPTPPYSPASSSPFLPADQRSSTSWDHRFCLLEITTSPRGRLKEGKNSQVLSLSSILGWAAVLPLNQGHPPSPFFTISACTVNIPTPLTSLQGPLAGGDTILHATVRPLLAQVDWLVHSFTHAASISWVIFVCCLGVIRVLGQKPQIQGVLKDQTQPSSQNANQEDEQWWRVGKALSSAGWCHREQIQSFKICLPGADRNFEVL